MSHETKSLIFIEKRAECESEGNVCVVSETKDGLQCRSTPLVDKQKNTSDAFPSKIACFRKQIVDWLKEVFLPQGYPHSVSPDYLEYQMWDSLQAFCSNLAGSLSLHATLVGIGVGQESASPLSAAIFWLMKDGTGMVSSIAFAYAKGGELDNNSKQWRLFADIVNDGALMVRLLAPVLPVPILATLCCSSMMSSLVGVAGGATRASLIQHQARCNNMADVAAKDGSQETLVNLAGLISSITLLPILTSSTLLTWTAFLLFVSLHIYTNYRGMCSIQMKTLNRPRLLYVFNHLAKKGSIPDVHSTNRNEPLLTGPAFISDYLTEKFRLELGVSLSYVSERFSDLQEFKHLFESQNPRFQREKYMVFLDQKLCRIYIVFHEEASNPDYLKSLWCAYLCALNFTKYILQGTIICNENKISFQNGISEGVLQAKETVSATIEELKLEIINKGWLLEPLRWKVEDWRLHENKE